MLTQAVRKALFCLALLPFSSAAEASCIFPDEPVFACDSAVVIRLSEGNPEIGKPFSPASLSVSYDNSEWSWGIDHEDSDFLGLFDQIDNVNRSYEKRKLKLDNYELSDSLISHTLYAYGEYELVEDQSTSIENDVLLNSTGDDYGDLGGDSAKKALILIHGWQGSGGSNNYLGMNEAENLPEAYFEEFLHFYDSGRYAEGSPGARYLFENYKVFLFHYPSFEHIRFNGRLLSEAIHRNHEISNFLADGGALTIIAHSMGGLVARSAIEEWGIGETVPSFAFDTQGNPEGIFNQHRDGSEVLDTLITLATPHRGSPASMSDWLGGQLALVNFVKVLSSPGALDLYPDNGTSAFTEILKHDPDYEDENGNKCAIDTINDISCTMWGGLSTSGDGSLLWKSRDLVRAFDDQFAAPPYLIEKIGGGSEVLANSNPWLSNLNNNFPRSELAHKYFLYSGSMLHSCPICQLFGDTLINPVKHDFVWEFLAVFPIKDTRFLLSDFVVPTYSSMFDFQTLSDWSWDELGNNLSLNLQDLSLEDKFFLSGSAPNGKYRYFFDYDHDQMKQGVRSDWADFDADEPFQFIREYWNQMNLDPNLLAPSSLGSGFLSPFKLRSYDPLFLQILTDLGFGDSSTTTLIDITAPERYIIDSDVGVPVSTDAIQQFLSSVFAKDGMGNTYPVTHDSPSYFPLGATTVTFTSNGPLGQQVSTSTVVEIVSLETVFTSVSGTKNTDVVLTLDGSPYRLTSNLAVIDTCVPNTNPCDYRRTVFKLDPGVTLDLNGHDIYLDGGAFEADGAAIVNRSSNNGSTIYARKGCNSGCPGSLIDFDNVLFPETAVGGPIGISVESPASAGEDPNRLEYSNVDIDSTRVSHSFFVGSEVEIVSSDLTGPISLFTDLALLSGNTYSESMFRIRGTYALDRTLKVVDGISHYQLDGNLQLIDTCVPNTNPCDYRRTVFKLDPGVTLDLNGHDIYLDGGAFEADGAAIVNRSSNNGSTIYARKGCNSGCPGSLIDFDNVLFPETAVGGPIGISVESPASAGEDPNRLEYSNVDIDSTRVSHSFFVGSEVEIVSSDLTGPISLFTDLALLSGNTYSKSMFRIRGTYALDRTLKVVDGISHYQLDGNLQLIDTCVPNTNPCDYRRTVFKLDPGVTLDLNGHDIYLDGGAFEADGAAIVNRSSNNGSTIYARKGCNSGCPGSLIDFDNVLFPETAVGGPIGISVESPASAGEDPNRLEYSNVDIDSTRVSHSFFVGSEVEIVSSDLTGPISLFTDLALLSGNTYSESMFRIRGTYALDRTLKVVDGISHYQLDGNLQLIDTCVPNTNPCDYRRTVFKLDPGVTLDLNGHDIYLDGGAFEADGAAIVNRSSNNGSTIYARKGCNSGCPGSLIDFDNVLFPETAVGGPIGISVESPASAGEDPNRLEYSNVDIDSTRVSHSFFVGSEVEIVSSDLTGPISLFTDLALLSGNTYSESMFRIRGTYALDRTLKVVDGISHYQLDGNLQLIDTCVPNTNPCDYRRTVFKLDPGVTLDLNGHDIYLDGGAFEADGAAIVNRSSNNGSTIYARKGCNSGCPGSLIDFDNVLFPETAVGGPIGISVESPASAGEDPNRLEYSNVDIDSTRVSHSFFVGSEVEIVSSDLTGPISLFTDLALLSGNTYSESMFRIRGTYALDRTLKVVDGISHYQLDGNLQLIDTCVPNTNPCDYRRTVFKLDPGVTLDLNGHDIYLDGGAFEADGAAIVNRSSNNGSTIYACKGCNSGCPGSLIDFDNVLFPETAVGGPIGISVESPASAGEDPNRLEYSNVDIDSTRVSHSFFVGSEVEIVSSALQGPVVSNTASYFIDADGDGVADEVDDFPSNFAAALDSDGDGAPDTWNNECDLTCRENSSLILDAFPDDFAASVDTDNDGQPDEWNASCDEACQIASGLILDEDDDNDGVSDLDETTRAYGSTRYLTVGRDGMVLADIDNDGFEDLVSIGTRDLSGNSYLIWSRNVDGLGHFSPGPPETLTAIDHIPNSAFLRLHVADMDGDQDLDVVVQILEGPELDIAIYENVNGKGTFGGPERINENHKQIDLIGIEDVDGDGDSDILASLQNDSIIWFENTETEFVETVLKSGITGSNGELVDIDSDGDLDIVYRHNFYHEPLYLLERIGPSDYADPSLISFSVGSPVNNVLAWGDVDSDGELDIVGGRDEIYWWGQNSGSFDGQLVDVHARDYRTRALELVDIDLDGDLDIVAAVVRDSNKFNLRWYENLDGRGDFSSRQLLPSPEFAPYALASADLDFDGDFEILVGMIVDMLILRPLDITNPLNPDTDGDGVSDALDKFPLDFAVSLDGDLDGYPDAWNLGCDSTCREISPLILDLFLGEVSAALDSDLDGVPDEFRQGCWFDNTCLTSWYASGLYTDGFPLDPDASLDPDWDGYPTEFHASCDLDCESQSQLFIDNCPTWPNDQTDLDGDGMGEECDVLPLDLPISFFQAPTNIQLSFIRLEVPGSFYANSTEVTRFIRVELSNAALSQDVQVNDISLPVGTVVLIDGGLAGDSFLVFSVTLDPWTSIHDAFMELDLAELNVVAPADVTIRSRLFNTQALALNSLSTSYNFYRRLLFEFDATGDADNDGLSNSLEIELGLDSTDPDSDGNGTNDGDEDSDADGFTNAEEVFAGTNPADSASSPGLIGEQGMAIINQNPMTVSLTGTYTNPVVILSPPSWHDSDPGVARVTSVTGNSFDVEFQEWDYLDGVHGAETIHYLVIEAGHYDFADGSELDVGVVDVSDTQTFESEVFTSTFSETPSLFLTLQSENDPGTLTVRARGVTPGGFDGALFEQESLNDGHGVEQVGYLALNAVGGTASLPLSGGPVSVSTLSTRIKHKVRGPDWYLIAGVGLLLEEEGSSDGERSHRWETIDVLSVEEARYVQDVSVMSIDPASIRMSALDTDGDGLLDIFDADADGDGLSNDLEASLGLDPLLSDTDGNGTLDGDEDSDGDGYSNREELDGGTDPNDAASNLYQPIGEQGMAIINQNPMTVSLTGTYTNPVVILSPPSWHDSDPGVARVTSVTGNSFDVEFQEWDYLDGVHGAETIHYLVIEAGHYDFADGSELDVGVVDVSDTQTFESEVFTSTFSETPSLFLTLQSENDPGTLTVRARGVTPGGFDGALFEQESLNDGHGVEQVGYLALNAVGGTASLPLSGGPVSVSTLSTRIKHKVRGPDWYLIAGVGLLLEEEGSSDGERSHRWETIDVLSVEEARYVQDVSVMSIDPASIRMSVLDSNSDGILDVLQ